MIQKSSSNKSALITGASSGLGKILAMKLAEKGYSLTLTGRKQSELSSIASYLRPHAPISFLPCDLADKSQREKILDLIDENPPDLLINGAGFGLYGDVLRFSVEDQMRILEVNTNAALEITLHAVQSLNKQKRSGTILNISSIAGYFVFPYFSMYSAAKACLTSFSQSINAETKEKNIRVLVSCPGQIDTNFALRASNNYYDNKSKSVMTKEYAAERILKQIEKQKSLDIFDFRCRLTLAVRYLFPKSFITHFIKKSMRTRFSAK